MPKVSKYTTQINFNPRPPRGGRLYSIIPHSLPRYFNPRPPRGGRRQSQRIYMTRCQISIHALRGEGDDIFVKHTRFSAISIHALRGEGDIHDTDFNAWKLISIHALRGEGDACDISGSHAIFWISIHALRGEGDRRRDRDIRHINNFNPRPPRGGRQNFSDALGGTIYFNPRPPRGGRLMTISTIWMCSRFQSTPSAGRATKTVHCTVFFYRFQSTPSAGRATNYTSRLVSGSAISIHALRGEGDPQCHLQLNYSVNFNPRPPRGGRPSQDCGRTFRCYFNPRPPRGGRHCVH